MSRLVYWKVWTRSRFRAAAALCVIALLLAAGCRGRDERAALAVAGPSPYVRCLAAAAPADVAVHAGGLVLRRKQRVLTIEGLRLPARIAAFSGPAFAVAPDTAAMAALRAAKPRLLLLLGGVGDAPEVARASVRTLADLEVPLLILAGGRDAPARIADAIEEVPEKARIMDVTPMREIRIGVDTFLPVAGALDGRYALADDACGYAESDLSALQGEIDLTRKARLWLLAWEAPFGSGPHSPAHTEFGSDAGSPALAAFAERTGARGGLFAWPLLRVLQASAARGERLLQPGEVAADLQLVVPRIAGPPLERADGSRIPAGFALLELTAGGLSLVGPPAPNP